MKIPTTVVNQIEIRSQGQRRWSWKRMQRWNQIIGNGRRRRTKVLFPQMQLMNDDWRIIIPTTVDENTNYGWWKYQLRLWIELKFVRNAEEDEAGSGRKDGTKSSGTDAEEEPRWRIDDAGVGRDEMLPVHSTIGGNRTHLRCEPTSTYIKQRHRQQNC